MRTWMARVRAVVAKASEPFDANHVFDALKLVEDNDRWAVRETLNALAADGELDREVVHGSVIGRGKKVYYRRTRAFRATEHDPEKARQAGAFLQGLVLSWGAKRHKEARAA